MVILRARSVYCSVRAVHSVVGWCAMCGRLRCTCAVGRCTVCLGGILCVRVVYCVVWTVCCAVRRCTVCYVNILSV